MSTLRWPGFRRLARQHWRMGWARWPARRAGVSSSDVRSGTCRLSLTAADVVPAHAGVRAQAVDRDGGLVDDFRIHHVGAVTAVRNAPSPAATSSLAIAEHVVANVLEQTAPATVGR